MGRALADLHIRSAAVEVPPAAPVWPWDWVDLTALGLDPVEPGDVGLVDDARRRAADLDLPVGLLHGDPTPDNFLVDDSTGAGSVAVIDWTSVMVGPLLFDLAALLIAADRTGARPARTARVIAAYATVIDGRAGPLADAATRRADALDPLLALRSAMEVVYYTGRLRGRAGTAAERRADEEGLAGVRATLRARL